ncbi:MAG: BamA/TamA family outer membrane protein [bacterium]|nr:BamA/TamA family outer membrane protein [bacterium]
MSTFHPFRPSLAIRVLSLLAGGIVWSLASSADAAPGDASPSLQASPVDPATASVQATSSAPVEDEGPGVPIRDVRVEGLKTLDEDTVLLAVPVQPGQEVTRSRVLESMQRIYGLGLFRDVRARLDESPFGGLVLVFTVEENPVLTGLDLQGVTVFPLAEVLEEFKGLEGKTLNFKEVQDRLRGLEERYQKAGYVLARVANLEVKDSGRLQISFAEGILDEIRLSGNVETQEFVIRREFTVKPGEVFNANRFQDDLRRIVNLNFFDEVVPRYDPVPDRPGHFVVGLALKEKNTGAINASAGWSTRDGVIGIASVRKDNLLGRAQSVSADVNISRNPSAEFSYFNPWIDEAHSSFGTGLYWRRFYNFFASFLEERRGFSLNYGRPLFGDDPITAQWRGSLKTRVEYVGLFDGTGGVQFNYDRPIPPVVRDGASTDPIWNGSIGYTVSFDSRDYLLNPSTGWFNTATIEQYLGLGNVSVTRLQMDVNRYFPLWFGHTLAFGLKLGSLQTPFGGDVPRYEQYFAIGPNLIRGWPETPGPADIQLAQQTGQAYAGDSFSLASLEYRFPVFGDRVAGALFGDTGIFWDQARQNFAWSRTRSGYGAGVRVNTPLGPLRLDLGFREWGRYAIHFSIGQKF